MYTEYEIPRNVNELVFAVPRLTAKESQGIACLQNVSLRY